METGKRIIITGGGSGLGKHMAYDLLSRGYEVQFHMRTVKNRRKSSGKGRRRSSGKSSSSIMLILTKRTQ